MSRRERALAYSVAIAAALTCALPSAFAGSTWSLRAPLQLQNFNGTTQSYDVVSNTTAVATQIPNGLTLTGVDTDSQGGTNRVFALTGAQYTALNPGVSTTNPNDHGIRLIAVVDGVLDQPYNSFSDRLKTTFELSVHLSGGSVEIFTANSEYGLADVNEVDLQNVGSSGFTATINPIFYGTSFNYLDNFGGPNVSDGTHIIADFFMGFEWSGYSPTDTFEFSLLGQGVTYQQIQVPEPSALALACVPMTLLGLRRRA
jgi:hypothetical protein